MAGDDGQWTLRNTGAYLFGAQIMMSTCMFIMICTYMIMGFVRVDTSGDGVAAWGTYPYPKTGFLPFGSTIWSLSALLVLTAVEFAISIAAFSSTFSASKKGLGAYVAGKTCILILYLCVFGLTTEWMGSEVAIAICYIVYSLASTYVALMLFNALSMGGYSAAVAGFSEGCQDEEEEQTPLRQQQQQPGYQTQSQYI
eukprot:Tamp_28926.p1 GENE.Tamp_28926~~Tamp_28926.p1  ORF type:complete len:212 (+),score=35.38 Tamp_28926:43-636(+)